MVSPEIRLKLSNVNAQSENICSAHHAFGLSACGNLAGCQEQFYPRDWFKLINCAKDRTFQFGAHLDLLAPLFYFLLDVQLEHLGHLAHRVVISVGGGFEALDLIEVHQDLPATLAGRHSA